MAFINQVIDITTDFEVVLGITVSFMIFAIVIDFGTIVIGFGMELEVMISCQVNQTAEYQSTKLVLFQELCSLVISQNQILILAFLVSLAIVLQAQTNLKS